MEKEDLIRLGRHIRQLRETAGLSQDELAKKSGFSGRAAISAIEKGKNNISIEKLPDLARALNTTPGELMDILVETTPSRIALIESYKTKIFNGDIKKLNEPNQARLMAYYQALLDSQEDDNGNT